MTSVKKFNVAVVGATGAVGGEMLRTLERRKFPVRELFPLASARSAGSEVEFLGEKVIVGALDDFDFSRADIALFSAGGEVSGQYAPKAGAAGCVVVDNSSRFRQDKDAPLVVTEVNPHRAGDFRPRNIIANPNCSTMQMLTALKPVYDAVGISRVNVATYQAVSGAGARAADELEKQTREALDSLPPTVRAVPMQIAFNAIPHIDLFQDNGYTREEMKMVWETHKILYDDSIAVNPTAVRVPVFYGHSEAIHIETETPLGADRARDILAEAPGVCVIDEHTDGGYPMPSEHAAGNDEVFVGRIRDDLISPTGLNLWVVSDNVRKGAALNAVQIAEILAAQYL